MSQIPRENFKRINVIGTSGSGKTTFARKLAAKLNVPHIEMDQVFWEPNWKQPTDEVFFSRLEKAVRDEVWVLDGNYNRSESIKWKNATAVIWLDFSFQRTLYQSLSRSFHRLWTRKELWPGTGNRESLRNLFSKDSIILWMLQTYPKMKVRYEQKMKDPKYSHIFFIRLRSPKECEDFLSNM